MNHFYKLFITLLVGLFFSALLVKFGIAGLFLVFAVAIFLYVLPRSELFAFLIVVYSIFLGFFTNQMPILNGMPFLGFYDELLIIAFCLSFVIKQLVNKGDFLKETNSIFVYVFGFCLVSILSALVNGVSLVASLNFMLSHIKWILFFITLLIVLNENTSKKYLYFLCVIGLVQLFLAIIQMLTFGSLNLFVGNEINIIQDAATGTFGYYGAHYLGHFAMMLFIYSFYLAAFLNSRKWFIIACSSLVLHLLTFTELDYFFLGVIAISFLFMKKVKFIKKGVLALFISLSCMVMLSTGLVDLDRYVKYLTRPELITSTGKVQVILLVPKVLNEFILVSVGCGPASFSSGAASKGRSALFIKYVKGQSLKKGTSTLDFMWSGFTNLLFEVGVLGAFFYYSILFFILIRIGKAYVFCKKLLAYEKALLMSGVMLIAFICYVSLLMSVFELAFLMLPFSILLAVSYQVASRNLYPNSLIRGKRVV